MILPHSSAFNVRIRARNVFVIKEAFLQLNAPTWLGFGARKNLNLSVGSDFHSICNRWNIGINFFTSDKKRIRAVLQVSPII